MTFTLIHVVISLIGIATGAVVSLGMLSGKRLDSWTAIFLVSTAATSVTGFGFPFDHLLPSHKVGILSLLVLAVWIVARYVFHLAGPLRGVYLGFAPGGPPFQRLVPPGPLFSKVSAPL